MWVALVNCKLWYIENIWSRGGEGGQRKLWIASKSSSICFSLPKFAVIFWFILRLSRKGNWIRNFNISILEIDFWIYNVDINFHSQILNICCSIHSRRLRPKRNQWPWYSSFIGWQLLLITYEVFMKHIFACTSAGLHTRHSGAPGSDLSRSEWDRSQAGSARLWREENFDNWEREQQPTSSSVESAPQPATSHPTIPTASIVSWVQVQATIIHASSIWFTIFNSLYILNCNWLCLFVSESNNLISSLKWSCKWVHWHCLKHLNASIQAARAVSLI